jgi:hypothetical protein
MKMVRIGLFGLGMLLNNCVNTSSSLTGSVVDGNIGLPIPNARVELAVYDFDNDRALKDNPVIYTDDDGVYTWSHSGTMLLVNGGGKGHPSKVLMTVSKEGYTSFSTSDYIDLSEAGVYNVKIVP